MAPFRYKRALTKPVWGTLGYNCFAGALTHRSRRARIADVQVNRSRDLG